MYNSSAEPNSSARAKKKKEVSQLAQNSFDTFKPYINVFDCGVKYLDSPIHLITKEDSRFYDLYKAGERPTYPDGSEFNPYLDVVRNIYGPEYVHRHIEHDERSYYTSGRKGQGLLDLDIDAHHAWQSSAMIPRYAVRHVSTWTLAIPWASSRVAGRIVDVGCVIAHAP